MSSLYKRPDSKYYWWTSTYKGRRLRVSTKMTQKHLARKIQNEYDVNLAMGDLAFLGIITKSYFEISKFIFDYLIFIESRKSENTLLITSGVMRKFQEFLQEVGVRYIDEISVKTIDDYIDWLNCSPKTKKNYLGIIKLLLEHAIVGELIKVNPAKKATLPQIVSKNLHRQLEPVDLSLIFEFAGIWELYYMTLYYTGLRAGDVAMLTYGNIDRKKKAIVGYIRKSRRIHEFPIAESLLEQISMDNSDDAPIFPDVYANSDRQLNNRLEKPRKHLQTILRLNGRPKATLHSFRVTYNNSLRDLGLSIEDRQILLAHSSSETTKIYTHPNFELARKYINMIPVYEKLIND